MMIDEEDEFYCQLAKAIKAWNWVEDEFYQLYATIMQGANHHLISVTFHHIESFESKLQLIEHCLKLLFDRASNEFKEGKKIIKKAREDLNKKRNRLVHEPVIMSHKNGLNEFLIHPSHFDARAITKGRTTYNGPVINSDYKPNMAKITGDHEIKILDLFEIERVFKEFSREIKNYNDKHFSTKNNSNKTDN